MLIDAPPTRLQLQRGQASHLSHARAARLCSAEGTLWITVDQDVKDIVLEAGQCFTVPGDRGVTISALSAQAVLDLHPAEARP